jgi:chromosome segregation ATPase
MLIPTLFASMVVALAGALVNRSALIRAHRRELEELEEDMTAAIDERYQAYLALEASVRRILDRLDQLDAETTEGLTRTGMRLNHLGRALALGMDGSGEQPAGGEALSAVEPQFEQRPKVEGKGTVDIADWQRRLEDLAAEKRCELERQERLMQELTTRLEALQTRVSERDEALIEGSEQRSAQLAHEAQIWRTRHLALEQETAIQLAGVRARADQADQLELELEVVRAETQFVAHELEQANERFSASCAAFELRLCEGQAREAESFARHSAQVQDLEQRIRELEPIVEREREAQREIDSLRGRFEQQRLRQEQVGAEFERQRNGLQGELEATRQARAEEKRTLEARVSALKGQLEVLEATQQQVTQLEQQLGERDRVLAEIHVAREAAAGREAQLTAAHQRLEENLSAARREIERWRAAAQAAEAERDAKLAELSEQFEALEEVTTTLREATVEHLGRIAALEDEERRLGESLARRTGDLEQTTGRLNEAERTLQAAFALLAKANLSAGV